MFGSTLGYAVVLMLIYGLLANAPILGGMPTSAAVFVPVSLPTRPSEAEAGGCGAL